jgi:hypothetical protein
VSGKLGMTVAFVRERIERSVRKKRVRIYMVVRFLGLSRSCVGGFCLTLVGAGEYGGVLSRGRDIGCVGCRRSRKR